MNERDMIDAALSTLGDALAALPDLAASGAITPDENVAAAREIGLQIASLSARLRTLILTGDGVTPVPDHGLVEALQAAVARLAAFNSAAGAWVSILTTVLNAANALAAIASSASAASSAGTSAASTAGSARVSVTPSLPHTTLALILAGTALCAATYAVVRSHK